ncbi:MAG: PaaI family thioesterase [bacterium]|nr:PaaI family thioesterase [bacterium]
MSYEIADDGFEERIRESFGEQKVMSTLGATLDGVEPGAVRIRMPFNDAFTQQDGFLHAGVVATLLDSACGYAAMSLLPRGGRVLAVEFKLNLCAPAIGEEFLAWGTVKRAGRTLTVTTGELFAVENDERKLVAAMQGTIFNLQTNQ